MNLALVDVLEAELKEAANKLRATGVRAESFVADVSNFAKAQEVADDILKRYESISVLVNNAGIGSSKGLLEISESEWDRTLAVNLKGCFNWSRAIVPSMQERGSGRIINIASIAAYSGGTLSKLAYAASKAGILGMTRSLAKELGPAITVNAICPGTISRSTQNESSSDA